MPEYTVSASVNISLDRTVRDAANPQEAEKEMKDYLWNSANIESEFFDHIEIMSYEIEDINEND